jgi:Flp pilus assembly protein TadG
MYLGWRQDASSPDTAFGAIVRKLDQRGVAGLEFCLVAIPLFTLMVVIVDLGRYAITVQSLRALANAGARAMMINDCYVNNVISKTSPTCSGDPLPTNAAKQAVAPFLYNGGLTPTLNVPATVTSPLTVTASQPNFTMLMPIWGTSLNAPSASTSVPF